MPSQVPERNLAYNIICYQEETVSESGKDMEVKYRNSETEIPKEDLDILKS